jgi:8-oxo-dGTP pyrophosphatase MutT (NUDIX family)
MLPDLYRVDDSESPNRQSRNRALFRASPSYSHAAMNDQHGTGWRIRSSTYPIVTPFLRLRSDVIELPNGTIIENYYVRETHGFAIIFALTPDERVVLVRQYKHGIGRVVLELPAGGMDAGETPAACAQRELAEETGYVGDEPELIRTYLADPTNSNGRFHLYLIRNAERRVAQAFDPTEDISVEFASLETLRGMARDGRIDTGSQVASIYAALEFLHLL